MDTVTQIVKALQDKAGQPEIGIVLGSGLQHFAGELTQSTEIPYNTLPGMPVCTVPGHKNAFAAGQLSGRRVLLMQGRFHYYEGYSPEELTRPIRVMAALGIKQLVLTCAVGAVNPSFSPGELVCITDHINLPGLNPLRGLQGERFIDMTEAYSQKLRNTAIKAAAYEHILLHQGVYCYFTGPSFETPAEIRAARALGADLVGMSTVMETIAARYAGMEVLGLACVTNMAAGMSTDNLSHLDVTAVGKQSADVFTRLLRRIVGEM